jgi:hypothetical protein
MNDANQQEERTEQLVKVRQVTHIQASWTERERGDDGDFTLQLILDHGAAEYVLRPTEDDLDVLLKLFKHSGSATFDMERKVLMFSNIATK